MECISGASSPTIGTNGSSNTTFSHPPTIHFARKKNNPPLVVVLFFFSGNDVSEIKVGNVWGITGSGTTQEFFQEERYLLIEQESFPPLLLLHQAKHFFSRSSKKPISRRRDVPRIIIFNKLSLSLSSFRPSACLPTNPPLSTLVIYILTKIN